MSLSRRYQGKHLSVLKNAGPGCITYYSGLEWAHVEHLQGCTILVQEEFSHVFFPEKEVECCKVADPQVEFYKLSAAFREDYLNRDDMVQAGGAWVHKDAQIGKGVELGLGAVIGACCLENGVRIGENAVVYAKTKVGSGTSIGASTVIGAAGMMWVWDGKSKIFLEQLGGVSIGQDCHIGSNITIVRGNANENTEIGQGTCIAHGSMIGHGCRLGQNVHLANSVALGGSVSIGARCFLGSGSAVSAGKTMVDEVILGAGAVLTESAIKKGVYVGVPAKWKSNASEQMSGMPMWTP
jgi:UDP-3-O-[3-hydroxymyristoyl] glucosamine N-acyltransferase